MTLESHLEVDVAEGVEAALTTVVVEGVEVALIKVDMKEVEDSTVEGEGALTIKRIVGWALIVEEKHTMEGLEEG